MKRKPITLCIIASVLLLTCGFYLLDRKNANKELANILEELDYDANKSIFNDEFCAKVKDIIAVYSFRTNGEIRRITKELTEAYTSRECYKDEFIQLSDEDMAIQVDDFLANTNNYGVGKVFIYTNNNYGEYLVKDMGYVDCYVYAYGLTDEPIKDLNAKIKIRGNSTATAPKKPYNIKFSEKVNLYGFGEAKKWSFLAEYFDPTMLRNNLFLNFAKELGLDYTSNCNYVEVWLDGNYNGCYLLTESVETGKNRVDIEVENEDFLIEYEATREEAGVTYITTEHGIRFALSDPEEVDDNTYELIKQKIDELDKTLYSGNYKKVEQLLDVDSFAKLYLVNEYAKTVDFGFSSVNFYYKDGKFFAGPVWDFDRSSGNASFTYTNYWKTVGMGKGELDYLSYEGLENWTIDGEGTNKIFSKLYEYSEFKYLVGSIFNENSEYMQSMFLDFGVIDSLVNDYGQLINNNYLNKENGGAGWKFSGLAGSNIVPFENYEDNVVYLKSWLKNRYYYLQKEFNQY